MNKRGVLITITTFIILWSLFMLNLSYINRNTELQNIVIWSANGNKIMFIEDDVLDDVYLDILHLNLSYVSKDSENITILFNGPILSKEEDHWIRLQEYEAYVEGVYSNLSNVDVELDNFNPEFALEPYSNTLLINESQLSLTTLQAGQIKSFYVEVVVNSSILNHSTNSSPTDSGVVPIIVKILDKNGNPLLADELAYLNPTLVSPAFSVVFADNSRIEVVFGYHLDKDGSFIIKAENLTANITKLKLTYNTTNEHVKITSGNILINITNTRISKQNPITLYTE